MLRFGPVALLAGVALLGLVTCDAAGRLLEAALGLAPVRSFREISVAEARNWLADAGAVLVRSEDAARRLREESAAEAGPVAPVVVLAEDDASGLRLAAELVRSGMPHVAVVRGGWEAWQATEPEQASAPKPRGS